MEKILVINPGSTSTKIGLFEDDNEVFDQTLRHSAQDIAQFATIPDQLDFRKKFILEFLEEKNVDINTLTAVIGRGGLVKPISGGTYHVTQKLIDDLKTGIQGQHASNLGGLLAYDIATPLNIPAFIADPVVVDEFEDVARFSGLAGVERKSAFHALNQKAIAKKYAKDNNKNYEDINVIVAHLGGGTSVGAHKKGKVIDATNAIRGEGPFTPERAGELPLFDIIDLCFSGKNKDEVIKSIYGQGGIVSYLETSDMRLVEEKALAGDKQFKDVYDAFIYQIAKEIGKFSTVLCGDVDAIILTGGVAYDKNLVAGVTKRVGFIAPVHAYGGEEELLALAQNALSVLRGETKSIEY